MLRGEISGADDRLSEATLRAFDQWFATQVDSVRQVSDAGRTDRKRPAPSDDSDRGSSSEDQRQPSVDLSDRNPDRWRTSSMGDLDYGGVSDDSDDKHDRVVAQDRSPQTFDDDPPQLTTSMKSLPVLPNRNAVYVADAILPPETVEESRDVHSRNGVNRKCEYEEECEDDLEVVLPSASPSPTKDTQMDMEFLSDDKDDYISGEMDTFAQEEATDLSLPKQNGDRKSSYISRGWVDEKNDDTGAGTGDYLSTGGSSGSEGGSSAQSPMTQAPPHGIVHPHNFLLDPSAAIAAAGLFSPSAPFYHHQRALQLAAMSRAAALGIPFHGKDITPLTSKPGIRSVHDYVSNVYSNSAPNIGAGKVQT